MDDRAGARSEFGFRLRRWLSPAFLVPAAVFCVALGLYLATAAPGLTWENQGADGGDLLTAAHTWGVPHPTGYPTYLLLLRAFSYVMPVGDEAYRATLMSALCGAAASLILYVALRRVVLMLPEGRSLRPGVVQGVAAVTAISVALSRELWSQATIIEVYALNALFLATVLLIAIEVRERRSSGRSVLFMEALGGFVIGVGLGNHLTLGLVAAPLAVWALWPARSGGTRRLAPRNWWPAASLLAGVSVYVYAPIASAQSPPLNWGHPDSAAGFWWMISGAIYQQYAFGIDLAIIPGRLASWADLFLAQFTAAGVVLGIVGLSFLWERARGFASAAAASIVLVSAYAISYNTADSFIYLIAAFLVFSMWIAAGLTGLISGLASLLARRSRPPSIAGWWLPAAVLVAAAATIPVVSFSTNLDGLNLRNDREAGDYAASAFAAAGRDSVILGATDEFVFSLWFEGYVRQPEAGVLVVSIGHLQFDWYWDDLVRQAPARVPVNRPAGFDDRLLAIVDHNLGRTPVFAAVRRDVLEREFNLVPVGPLFRIEPRS